MPNPNDMSLYIHTYQFICKLQVRANTSTYKNMKMNHIALIKHTQQIIMILNEDATTKHINSLTQVSPHNAYISYISHYPNLTPTSYLATFPTI